MRSTDQVTPSALFWAWFRERNHEYGSLNRAENKEQLLDQFQNRLHQYDDCLAFEISEPMDDGSNELIITAEGLVGKFPEVEALIEAAPELPGWKFVAFKQPLGFDFIHEYGNLTIDPRSVWFLPMRSKSDPSILGLRVGLPDFDETNAKCIKNSIWIVLDTGLGERVCAERIRHVEVTQLPPTPEDEGFIKLKELPEYLQWNDRRDEKVPATA